MQAKPGPRERLLSATRELTYSQGAHVGLDAILRAAQVARRSVYQHFGGKDRLVAEALDTTETLTRLRAVMAAAGDDPAARVLAAFDDLRTMTADPSFRGCRYTAAELALPAADHPVHVVVRDYKRELHEVFETELTRLGHPDAVLGATQLVVLIDGVLALAVTRPASDPALAARPLAEMIVAGTAR
ncbi:TetR/AcrR family transcriptional regulator [Nocardia bovistercoris]|uniref:TetR/AcrR family transcriptional regulator n=1 Tax=Nocardia bovistercoris TaxID=2785916 RepID=A0A931IHU9_9NOCA|nr:TetR/AcrR family transcriptional regulator [Nocardia bovistercoris]MBH0781691.1 TetR/AcrR family transcriptional regulator [Nocardia bovistercoris]